MVATPSHNKLPLRAADFATLAEALDYAAEGDTGCNFYTGRGELYAVLSYAQLREQAQALARRFQSLNLERGSRVALIAETHPDFLRFFFACQYAGLVPVPLPVSINLGSHKAYVRQLRDLLVSCQAAVAITPSGFVPFLEEAAVGLGLRFLGDPETFGEAFPEQATTLSPLQSQEVAYLQYTSGSTRFPRGVMITQQAVLNNLAGIIQHGVKIRPGDRGMSWLPFYHDMGLVGCLLVPVAAQLSMDYLSTRDFAMRPRQWLALLTQNRATISFSPPFGYELCARRLRPEEVSKFDLSAWRVAGVGAEMIRPETLARFAQVLAPSGFDARAFLACYGMAECSLAVSFAPLGEGLGVDYVDGDYLAARRRAVPLEPATVQDGRVSSFVNCGAPLPDYEVVIRDEQGRTLPERHSGIIYVKSPSVMSGYFNDPGETRRVLSADGWLNTGDIGYRIGARLIVTGRQKDMMIINGRNIWPQDLEYLAEQQPEVRPGDALAFAAPGPDGADLTVLVVQCRETDAGKRADLVARLQGLIREELGIDCFIELVPLHTLPRTSSGKLSRSKARQNFIDAHRWEAVAQQRFRPAGALSLRAG
ncbi:MAG: fatty acyl-AMP ligase [Candidatus Competibacteraceae bacterium]